MRFPNHLWPDQQDDDLVRQAVQLFESVPLVLTDELTNSIYFNAPAERLFGDSGEALVNRAGYSLLGYDDGGHAPEGLAEALLGKSGPFRTVVRLPGAGGQTQPVFVEASAIMHGPRHLCGVVRFSTDQA